MARETGSGKTPQRVVDELNKKLSETSLNAISKATGVGVSALHRYQRGIGEPTTATLEKLADYFVVSVAYLRGEERETPEWMSGFADMFQYKVNHDVVLGRIVEALKSRRELESKDLYSRLGSVMGYSPSFIGQVLNGKRSLTQRFVENISGYLNVSVGWLMGGTDLSYDEIQTIFTMDVPMGIAQLAVEGTERALAIRGIKIPVDEGAARSNFLDIVKHVVKREGEFWKACHIEWGVLSLQEIDTVLGKLNAARLKLLEKDNNSAVE